MANSSQQETQGFGHWNARRPVERPREWSSDETLVIYHGHALSFPRFAAKKETRKKTFWLFKRNPDTIAQAGEAEAGAGEGYTATESRSGFDGYLSGGQSSHPHA